MSDGAPPAAPAAPDAPATPAPATPAVKTPMPAGTAPVKIPMKGVLGTKISMDQVKMMVKGAAPPGMKMPMPKPASKGPPVPPIAPTAKPVAAPAPPQTKKTVRRREESSSGSDSDDGLLATLGVGGGAPKREASPPKPRAKPVAKRTVSASPPTKRRRTPPPPPSESSSSESEAESTESGDEEDNMNLLAMAQQANLVPTDIDLEERVDVGPPPRPPQIKYPGDLEKKLAALEATRNKKLAAVQMKDDNKAVSLSTSKMNYIDPRVICAWSKRENVPINRLYGKSVLKKFPWAVGCEEDYEF